MNYQNHIDAGSLLNTPPVFAVYVTLLTLRWIKKEGGLIEMEKRAEQKSSLLYQTIDSLPLFHCPIKKKIEVNMNAVFYMQ
jgi:phosphoserine aminotransferase